MASKNEEPAASHERHADTLIAVSRALVGIAVRSVNAAPVEITLVQHRLLVLLASGGAQTVGALAAQLEVNASNASRLVDRLQRLDLVSRGRSAEDGRVVTVSLTATGRDLLAEVHAYRRREVQRVLGRMTTGDVDVTIRALTAFADAAHEMGEMPWSSYLV
ncbi:MarR family winged helix-turn-helix transcriptional regulator [Cumulibacter manganitolerans]|uniref:MarR family winged helix-turn-helix transcriptional regulator n=1 Tax=Cumulibacter manganitolerans TaxID=1884992 RepID=UPI0018860E7B|nr:MarR family transcriptional regulator [Cumulibacter manganitolerans]